MQDRFKFRVWDKENKKFLYYLSFDISSNGMLILFGGIEGKQYLDVNDTDRYILMQSTGLKDKNGKLIYEGDIVKEYYYNTKETAIKKIIFDENICGYVYTDGIEYNSLCFSDCRRLEVIGNIYENKELLNENSRN